MYKTKNQGNMRTQVKSNEFDLCEISIILYYDKRNLITFFAGEFSRYTLWYGCISGLVIV